MNNSSSHTVQRRTTSPLPSSEVNSLTFSQSSLSSPGSPDFALGRKQIIPSTENGKQIIFLNHTIFNSSNFFYILPQANTNTTNDFTPLRRSTRTRAQTEKATFAHAETISHKGVMKKRKLSFEKDYVENELNPPASKRPANQSTRTRRRTDVSVEQPTCRPDDTKEDVRDQAPIQWTPLATDVNVQQPSSTPLATSHNVDFIGPCTSLQTEITFDQPTCPAHATEETHDSNPTTDDEEKSLWAHFDNWDWVAIVRELRQ